MTFLSLCLLLTARPTWPLEVSSLQITNRQDNLVEFSVDFGSFEVRKAKATLDGQPRSVRWPASITKAQRSYPEIDFIARDLEEKIFFVLAQTTVSLNSSAFLGIPSPLRGEGRVRVKNKGIGLQLASLEKLNSRGIRLAKGELWLDGQLAIKFSLMESKWSADAKYWWLAYPAQYNTKTKDYEELVVMRSKEFKKRMTNLVREEYLKRYESD